MKKVIILAILLSGLYPLFAQNFPIKAGFTDLRPQSSLYSHQAENPFHDIMYNGYRNESLMMEYDSLNMRFIGNWPLGSSYSIRYSGTDDIYFVGAGAAVLIIDAADPSAPQILSTIHARALVDAIWYDHADERLYLAAYFSGIEIWDVSELSDPFRLTRFSIPALPRGGVFEQDNYVYVVTVADGVYVYDISDLSDIQSVAWVNIPGSGLVWNSCKNGNYLFCAAASSGVSIIDISDPLNAGVIETIPGSATGVFSEDDYAYVASYNFGLKIYDISDIENAQLMGEIELEGTPNRVSVLGDHAIVALQTHDYEGIQIIDITDKTNPQKIAGLDPYARHVAASTNKLVFTGGTYGINFADATDMENPVIVHTHPLPADTWDVCIDGDYAYSGSYGFRVIDISDKEMPETIGSTDAEGVLTKKSGNIVVLAPKSMGSSNPVSTIDVSDPANPQKRGEYMAPVMTYDLDINGNYTYIACWWDGFRVLDISDPDNPTLAAHAFGWENNNSVPGEDFCYVQALDTEGDHLYIIDYGPFEADDTKGLYIFDIADPENPQLLFRYQALMSAGNDLEVRGDYAYIADKNGGFEVINVADPLAPYSVAYTQLPDVAYAVDADENFAYVANYIIGGIQMFDISDPENPVLTGMYKRSGCFAVNVSVQDKYTYIADGPAGIGIYQNMLITGQEENEVHDGRIQIYPNPFSSGTTFEFTFDTDTKVKVGIFDLNGSLVREIFEGRAEAGKKQFSWDGCDDSGMGVSNGIYLLRTETDAWVQSKKLGLFR